MNLLPSVGAGVGNVSVVTTSDGGHPPEFFAQRIVDRLIMVGDTAPEPIKAQALAYRDMIYQVVLDGVCRAIASDRAYRKDK